MYDIALSVAACVRSGTRADVAWMLAPIVSDDALAFTPGGGRIGSLAGGVLKSPVTITSSPSVHVASRCSRKRFIHDNLYL